MNVNMAQVFGAVVSLFVGALGLTIIVWIWTGKIDLSQLLSEANGQASMSRFQLMVFTFVIAIGLFDLVARGTNFPEVPSGVLTLLGISASTYAVGKGISYSQPDLMMQTSGDGTDDKDDSGTQAQAAADQAKAHAAAAQAAATASMAAKDAAEQHAATAQQAASDTEKARAAVGQNNQ